MVKLPRGYERLEVAEAAAFSVPGLRPWAERALAGGTLHGRAAAEAEATLQGRGPVHVVEAGGRPRAVRHYFRGGAVAALLGDRYLRVGEPRPLAELRASEAARSRGVPSPRVVAGAVYPAGVFYRADLVTDYVPGARDLAAWLFGEAGPDERRAALAATGTLVARMAAAGLRHPDLNAGNVLLTTSDDGLRALLLDLDRCALAPPGRSASSGPLLARLERSLRKLSGATGRPPPSSDELALLREAADAGGTAP